MLDNESLPYEQFARLLDNDILKSSPLKLLENARHNNNENNYKLYTIVANYRGDSIQIQDSDFDIRYYKLRKDKDPKRIFTEYSNLVSKFNDKKQK